MEFAGCATQELRVSTASPLDAREQVRQAIDIVDLIGSHVQLRRQGRNYVGLCPWHDDSRPSLQVNPERQSFKCWVCDIGGDIFSFVMKVEGVEFREALEILADRAGIQLQPARQATVHVHDGSSTETGAPATTPAQDKRTLYKAMAWAEGEYHKCLLESPDGESARKYLDDRGIDAASIEKFHLGFSPNQRDWIVRRVEGSAARQAVLEAIGLVARPQEGDGLYDRFRGRLLFSIRDAQGRPVGVGGRVLPESGSTSPAKYINSPETPLFSKSNLPYGLDVARDAMRKSRTALVMEGYTDCIVAHQYGFGDAVAVLGTALGEGHVRILKRFADRIVLVLDGDEAGQRRANEVLELFVAQQVDLQILTLPQGSDPCDFLHQHGAEAFADLLAHQAVDALEHAFQTATRGVDLERDVHRASQALEHLVSILAKAPRDTAGVDRLREDKVLQRFAARFRVDEQEVRRRLTALRRRASRRVSLPSPAEAPDVIADEAPPQKMDPTQRELLELLLGHPESFDSIRAAVDVQQIPRGRGRQIFEVCCRLAESGAVPTFERLMLQFDDPVVKSLLVELDEQGQAKREHGADPEVLLRQLANTFANQEADKQRPGQIATLREGGLDDRQASELLEEILRQEKSRQGISEPTDG